MDADSVDPAIASAVTEIVNRFGAPGLDQLERATALARPAAQRVVIASVEQPHVAESSVALEMAREMTHRLADWRVASDAVRLECEAHWLRWAKHLDAQQQAPTEEDKRRLYAFYSVEHAARDQFFSQMDATT